MAAANAALNEAPHYPYKRIHLLWKRSKWQFARNKWTRSRVAADSGSNKTHSRIADRAGPSFLPAGTSRSKQALSHRLSAVTKQRCAQPNPHPGATGLLD